MTVRNSPMANAASVALPCGSTNASWDLPDSESFARGQAQRAPPVCGTRIRNRSAAVTMHSIEELLGAAHEFGASTLG